MRRLFAGHRPLALLALAGPVALIVGNGMELGGGDPGEWPIALLLLSCLALIILGGTRDGAVFHLFARDVDEREMALRDRAFRIAHLATHAILAAILAGLWAAGAGVIGGAGAVTLGDLFRGGLGLLMLSANLPMLVYVWLQPVPPHPRQDLDDPTPV